MKGLFLLLARIISPRHPAHVYRPGPSCFVEMGPCPTRVMVRLHTAHAPSTVSFLFSSATAFTHFPPSSVYKSLGRIALGTFVFFLKRSIRSLHHRGLSPDNPPRSITQTNPGFEPGQPAPKSWPVSQMRSRPMLRHGGCCHLRSRRNKRTLIPCRGSVCTRKGGFA